MLLFIQLGIMLLTGTTLGVLLMGIISAGARADLEMAISLLESRNLELEKENKKLKDRNEYLESQDEHTRSCYQSLLEENLTFQNKGTALRITLEQLTDLAKNNPLPLEVESLQETKAIIERKL